MQITSDGSFRSDGLVPGNYQSQIAFRERSSPGPLLSFGKIIATASFKLEITEDSPEQIDLGEIPVEISKP